MLESVCLSMILGNAPGRSLSPCSNSSWCICFTDPCGPRRKPRTDSGDIQKLRDRTELVGEDLDTSEARFHRVPRSAPEIRNPTSNLLFRQSSRCYCGLAILPDEAYGVVTENRTLLRHLLAMNIEAEKPAMASSAIAEMVLSFFSGLCIERNPKSGKASSTRKIENFMTALRNL